MSAPKLTKEQADFYHWEVAYYKNNVRVDNKRADAFAWRSTVKAFPCLKTK